MRGEGLGKGEYEWQLLPGLLGGRTTGIILNDTGM